MTEKAANAPKYKVFIFSENEDIKNLLKKVLEKRGYDITVYIKPERCTNYAVSVFRFCLSAHACADIVIMGRHIAEFRSLDFIERQIKGKCKVPLENKLVIASTFDEIDTARAKALGVCIMHMPFTLAELHKWLDGCEERLEKR